jgi:hypothetical protein
MKKIILFLLFLEICAVAVFSYEKVGKIIINQPEIKIEFDFYDTNVDMEIIVEIIKNCIISTKSKGLLSIDNEEAEILVEELNRLYSIINWSKFEYENGLRTDYFVAQSNIKYKGKEYFIITIAPEDRTWYFEIQR